MKADFKVNPIIRSSKLSSLFKTTLDAVSFMYVLIPSKTLISGSFRKPKREEFFTYVRVNSPPRFRMKSWTQVVSSIQFVTFAQNHL